MEIKSVDQKEATFEPVELNDTVDRGTMHAPLANQQCPKFHQILVR
jgi:hypothetical protein